MFDDKGPHFLQGGFVLDDIGFVQREDNLLAPGENALEELSLALGERMISGSSEQHQVAARHEFIRQALMVADDRVGARRIDNIQFLQKRQRISVYGKILIYNLLGSFFSPLDKGHA